MQCWEQDPEILPTHSSRDLLKKRFQLFEQYFHRVVAIELFAICSLLLVSTVRGCTLYDYSLFSCLSYNVILQSPNSCYNCKNKNVLN